MYVFSLNNHDVSDLIENLIKSKKISPPQQQTNQNHIPQPTSNGDSKVFQYLEQQDLFNKRMLEQGNGDSGSSGRLHNQSENQSNGSSGIQ